MKKDFVISTASDPLAFELESYLAKKGFVVPAGDLADVATVMVFDTTKQKLEREVKRFLDEKGISGMTRKAIRIGEVRYKEVI